MRLFRPACRQGLIAVLAALLATASAQTPARQAAAPAPARADLSGAIPPGAPPTFRELARRLSPAVVNISTSTNVSEGEEMPEFPPGSPLERFNDFFRRRGGLERSSSLGSGFVISPDGLIVTNNHVIAEADEIEVAFPDGLTLKATLVGADPDTDLALLKVAHNEALPFVAFGESDTVEVGDWVVAIGNPFGLGGTVTAGIVSARSRDINAGRFDDFIQTDAAINRGNSGGPLFNLDGEVVGVNTAIISPTGGSVGIGFSVPAALAEQVIGQLQEFGETRRGWLGVNVQEVSPAIAQSYGLPRATGALISRIEDGGPADEAGLEVGDLVLSVGGTTIRDTRALARRIAEVALGASVDMTFLRNGRRQTAKVTVREQPKDDDAPEVRERTPPDTAPVVANALGLELGALTDEARRRYRIPASVQGVLVQRVDSRSDASGDILIGDVIVEIQFTPVTSPRQANEEIAKLAASGGGGSILLQIDRRGVTVFRSIRPRR